MKTTSTILAAVLTTTAFAQSVSDSVNVNQNPNDTLYIEVQEFTTGVIKTLAAADADITDTLTATLNTTAFSVTPPTAAVNATSNDIGDIVPTGTLNSAVQDEYVFNTTIQDAGGLSMTAVTKVKVTPLTMDDIKVDTILVAENSAALTETLSAFVTLPSGSVQQVTGGVTFTIGNVNGQVNPDWTIVNGELVVPANLNYEQVNEYAVEVTATRGNLDFTDTIVVLVTNVNEAPFKVFVK